MLGRYVIEKYYHLTFVQEKSVILLPSFQNNCCLQLQDQIIYILHLLGQIFFFFYKKLRQKTCFRNKT